MLDGTALEAAQYYLSLFKNEQLGTITYYPKTPSEELADFQLDRVSRVSTVEFQILGVLFIGINAGPEFKFAEAVSFMIPCKDHAEIESALDARRAINITVLAIE